MIDVKRIAKHVIAAVSLVLSFAGPAAAGPIDDAFARGDYAAVMREVLPLAVGGMASAQSQLGWMYEQGKGVPQDYETAVIWYRKAADQGFSGGQFFLGYMYYTGHGVPQDHVEAVKWWRKAADQGHADAEYNLGATLYRGEGVTQDYAAALAWYRKAADQRHSFAQANLGFMYLDGRGVPQDYVTAHMWFNLSAAAGNEDAARSRDFVAAKMTPAQIAEAQRLAREWKPK